VAKTHRAVIIDEGWYPGGFAAEAPVPSAVHLEDAAIPQTATIVGAVNKLLGRREAPNPRTRREA
jgi:hypothetical protein